MKNFFNHIILFIVVFLFGSGGVYAQLYPVQLTPVFNNPYSVKIADYATSMDTKMQLLINPTDITISQRQVRLKFYIQGNGLNIQSSDYIQGQQPIFINGGELKTLTNIDISALFRLENLQGITTSQYANGLPEGMYSFCFEMYDFVTNQKISQKSCASLYLILNDPPLLNTPQKNEQIASSDFPNIMFTWTPRQRNATNVSYKFELKQLIDPTLDPQFAFQMSPLLYEETLFSTAMLYNLSMPILTPGMRYAWRVRAISNTGLSENAIFKNDGYSEIYSFKYTASCAAPTFLLSEALSPTSVKITWQGIPDHTKYQVQYKKQDVRNAQWFSTNSLNTQSLITNLEPGVTYQFRVGSSCDPATEGVQSFTYSGISTFTTTTQTNGVPAYNCGIIPKNDIQNQKPLTNLIQSETFTAGDFPVTVLELQEQHSPYSGRGYIIVPYLKDTKIAVEFSNITINTDYQLINGVVETSYDPNWKNVVDVGEIANDFKGLVNEIAGLFDKANDLLKQKEAGTISQSDFDKNWADEVMTNLKDTQEKYKKLVNGTDYPDEIKKEIEDLKAPLDDLASTNYTTAGTKTKEDLDKVNSTYDKVNKLISEKCETDLKNIVAFLNTEKVNYLKLLASEVSNTKSTAQGTKLYTTSVYDEEKGNLKITHYKGWSISNPPQNLFLIETKDTELNKQGIKSFWLSYTPNVVDGFANTVETTIYFRDSEPKENEPDYCTKTSAIPKGVSTQAQFADDLGQIVFYTTLGVASAEVYSGIKTYKCAGAFTLDLGLQALIISVVKKYKNPKKEIKLVDIADDISFLSATASCVTATVTEQCDTKCAVFVGAVTGFGDDIIKQLKEGKSLSEIDITQSADAALQQAVIAGAVQKLITFGTATLAKKYSKKEIVEAFEDLEKNPEKYGINLPSLVRQLSTKPIYKPLRTIFSKPDKTTTFIGKWQDELSILYKELHETTDLNIYMNSGKFENKGGFNMLSIENWSTEVVEKAAKKGIKPNTKAFDDFIWDVYNKPWLESAMQRGDEIIIWSNPNNLPQKEFIDGIGKTFYERELEFLRNNSFKYGYDYNKGVNLGTFSK